MAGIAMGFALVAVLIAIGYVAARMKILGEGAQGALARTVFYLAAPALLFRTLSEAPIEKILSPLLLGVILSAALVSAITLVILRLRGRPKDEAILGALSSSYVNAANVGLPIAVYVLGDASYAAPVVLFQLGIAAPIALGALDALRPDRAGLSWGKRVAGVFNPIVVASLVGMAVTLTGVSVPALVKEPVDVMAGAAVPLALVAFGMSLHGGVLVGRNAWSTDVILQIVGKSVAHPIVGYLVGRFVIGLEGIELTALTVLAALPTAQNVFVYAVRYGRSEDDVRSVVLATTVLAMPVLVVISLLLT